VHPVGSYCTDISRCTVNRTVNKFYSPMSKSGGFFTHLRIAQPLQCKSV